MGDVVSIQPPKDLVWMCADCGCSYWQLHQDGTLECSNCRRISTNNECEWAFPPPPMEPKTAAQIVTANPDVQDFTIQRFKKLIDEECIAIIITHAGMIHTFNGRTPAKTSRSWLFQQVREALRMLKGHLE